MVDNFKQIENLINFNDGNGVFFHCQIVQRAKDHKGEEEKVREGAIKTYFIRSKEHLERVKKEIILLCEHYGARAYINIGAKSIENLNSHLLVKLATDMADKIVRSPRKLMNSAAGELKPIAPRWIIDVDYISMKEDILEWLDSWFAEYKHASRDCYLYAEVPTKSGLHLITDSFDLKKFSEEFPDVDVHKNSRGTMLYSPKSID